MGVKTTQVHESKPLTSNQNATLQIPASGKIQSLLLQFSTGAGVPATEADIRAEMGNVRVTLGGKDIVNTTSIKLLDLYETLGVNVSESLGVAGVLELNIGRLFYIDPLVRDLFGWGTADVTSIQVQVTAGTLNNIASVQAFTEREPINENLGAYMKFVDYPQTFNATGDHTVDTLPRDIDSSYLLVMCDDGSAGTITVGESRVNSITLHERTPSNINKCLLSNRKMVQPAGYFVYGFGDGSLGGRLPMKGVADLRFISTFSVAPGAQGYVMSALTLVNLPA